MQTAQKKSLIVLSILVVITAALWLPVVGTFFDTTLIDRDSERFFGIKPLKKRTTSVIIVHGIGNHCIGYADELVQNLFRDVADKSIESIEESYQRYVAALSEPISTQAVGGSYKVSSIERLRDGSCQVV